MERLKSCRDCGVEKPVTEFSPTSRGVLGVAAYCRPCMSKRARETYSKRYAKRRRENFRKWREANLESCRLRSSDWQRANPGKVREASRRRRARKSAVWTPDGDEYATSIEGDPCSYCGDRTNGVDHIEPLHGGGQHDPTNLTACCPPCNLRKREKPLLYFLATR